MATQMTADPKDLAAAEAYYERKKDLIELPDIKGAFLAGIEYARNLIDCMCKYKAKYLPDSDEASKPSGAPRDGFLELYGTRGKDNSGNEFLFAHFYPGPNKPKCPVEAIHVIEKSALNYYIDREGMLAEAAAKCDQQAERIRILELSLQQFQLGEGAPRISEDDARARLVVVNGENTDLKAKVAELEAENHILRSKLAVLEPLIEAHIENNLEGKIAELTKYKADMKSLYLEVDAERNALRLKVERLQLMVESYSDILRKLLRINIEHDHSDGGVTYGNCLACIQAETREVLK